MYNDPASYSEWDELLEHMGVVAMIEMSSEKDQGLDALKLLGYAVLQNIEKTNVVKKTWMSWTDTTKEALDKTLKISKVSGLNSEGIEGIIQTLEKTILDAMKAWEVSGGQWDILNQVLSDKIFSTAKDIPSVKEGIKKIQEDNDVMVARLMQAFDDALGQRSFSSGENASAAVTSKDGGLFLSKGKDVEKEEDRNKTIEMTRMNRQE